MRRLMLLRHAKAQWPQDAIAGDDYDRPLAPRGEAAALRMGLYLQEQMLLPDMIIASTAVRAQRTMQIMTPFFDAHIPHCHEPRLYMASPSNVCDVIRGTPTAVSCLLLIGHNPALGELSASLIGSGDRYAFARLKTGVPTASLTVLDFMEHDWHEIGSHKAKLERFVCPNDIMDQPTPL